MRILSVSLLVACGILACNAQNNKRKEVPPPITDTTPSVKPLPNDSMRYKTPVQPMDTGHRSRMPVVKPQSDSVVPK